MIPRVGVPSGSDPPTTAEEITLSRVSVRASMPPELGGDRLPGGYFSPCCALPASTHAR